MDGQILFMKCTVKKKRGRNSFANRHLRNVSFFQNCLFTHG